VEPEDTSAEVIGTVLENMHYHVQRAVDGKEAQAMAEQCLPTLILSEVMLPKLDGFALRQRLLMRSETKNIPMLYMSHLKTEDSVRRAADLGVIHYLKKPLMLAEIQGIIRNLTDRGEES
jgi:DNA-binding response OmpR family regulator